MKKMNNAPTRPTLRGLVLALAATVLATGVATAHPYATCLTNNAGVVSFRLNEAADSVKILWNSGASSYTIGALTNGLTVTNLTAQGVTSPFQVEVTKAGSGTPALISDNNNVNNQFYGPRAVGVNKRPASPYFGRIYVGNSPGTTGSGRATGDGIYVLNADSSDAVGQGNTALTAGLDMVAASASMPWRIRPGQDDDMLYICDWTDPTGNLFRADPNVSGASGVNMFMAPVGSMASPLDPSMNHGSLSEVYVTGSTATSDLTVYTVDEDYETTPGFLSELNSLWQYNIGAGSIPWSTYPDLKIATPAVATVGQTMGLDRGTNGYWYLMNNRSSGNENCLQVIDPSGPTVIYESRPDSMNNYAFPRDILSNCTSVAVSPDMKFLAAQRGSGIMVIVPLVNGIPNLGGRIEFTAIGTARQTAFDAANNVYTISASTERMRVYSLGLTTTATTTSNPAGNGGAGGAFGLTTPATTVGVTADTATVYEAGPTTAVLTFTRAGGSLATPLTVTFAPSGTATRGTDYVLQTNSVTFTGNSVVIPAGVDNVAVSLIAQNDAVAELTETAILGIVGTTFYSAGSPPSQTVSIIDNEKPMIDVSVVQASVYERLPNDYARFRLTRRGDLSAASFQVNVSWSGTAAGTRYTVPANPVATFNPDDVTMDVDIAPVDDSLLQGNQTIICTIAAAGASEYDLGTNSPSGTATIVDDEVPAETTVLYSENFNTDNSVNWTTNFGSGNDIFDARYVFNNDYSSGLWFPAIPQAPHSTADSAGLYLTVNKDETTALGAAGINTYPVGQSFSGNYAVRFDMYLMIGAAASTTEYALFGIATSGTKTNWFRNSTGGVPGGGSYDGLWFGVESDAAALGDYVIYSGPTTAGNNPTALTAGVNASTLTGTFKSPPYGASGAPGCTEGSATPCWSDVEICKIGRYVRLKINNTFIMSYTNAVADTNGNIMLGYCDAYDSIMTGASGVTYDNLRVVRLNLPITVIKIVGANAEVTFTWGVDEATTAFKLQSCATVNGTYADEAGATITKLSPGVYKATVATVPAGKYFRVRYAIP